MIDVCTEVPGSLCMCVLIKVTPLHHRHLENLTKLFLNKQVYLNTIALKCVGFILVFGRRMDGWMDG